MGVEGYFRVPYGAVNELAETGHLPADGEDYGEDGHSASGRSA